MYEWIRDGYRRRSALRDVESAIRRGWLDGPDQADRRRALCEAVADLVADPATREREILRLGRIVALMGERSL